MIKVPNKKQNREPRQKHQGQFRGSKKQQSSMEKPGIPSARIPESTKSSHPAPAVFCLVRLARLSYLRVRSSVWHVCLICLVRLARLSNLRVREQPRQTNQQTNSGTNQPPNATREEVTVADAGGLCNPNIKNGKSRPKHQTRTNPTTTEAGRESQRTNRDEGGRQQAEASSSRTKRAPGKAARTGGRT